jgi:hypothetical protein
MAALGELIVLRGYQVRLEDAGYGLLIGQHVLERGKKVASIREIVVLRWACCKAQAEANRTI